MTPGSGFRVNLPGSVSGDGIYAETVWVSQEQVGQKLEFLRRDNSWGPKTP